MPYLDAAKQNADHKKKMCILSICWLHTGISYVQVPGIITEYLVETDGLVG